MDRKPVIGLVASRMIIEDKPFIGHKRVYVNYPYIFALEKCGALPLVLPVSTNEEDIRQQISCCDGILLTGGSDLDCALYDQQPGVNMGYYDSEVDRHYILTTQLADKNGIPVLGICKGIQAINVAFGGTLIQDIPSQVKGCIQHNQTTDSTCNSHDITVSEKNSVIYSIYGAKNRVNSFHHQCVDKVAKDFKVVARASDGVIEAIEHKSGTPIIGVQWHPEMLSAVLDEKSLQLFQTFVDLCKK